MRNEYNKAFDLMRDSIETIELENELLIDRLRYLEYFIDKFGHEFPNGKQEISCFKLIDTLKDIIHGNVGFLKK